MLNNLARFFLYVVFYFVIMYFGLKTFEAAIKLTDKPFIVDRAPQNDTQRAFSYIGKACYQEFDVQDHLKTLEKRYISEDIKPYLGYTGNVLKIMHEKRVVYTWRF